MSCSLKVIATLQSMFLNPINLPVFGCNRTRWWRWQRWLKVQAFERMAWLGRSQLWCFLIPPVQEFEMVNTNEMTQMKYRNDTMTSRTVVRGTSHSNALGCHAAGGCVEIGALLDAKLLRDSGFPTFPRCIKRVSTCHDRRFAVPRSVLFWVLWLEMHLHGLPESICRGRSFWELNKSIHKWSRCTKPSFGSGADCMQMLHLYLECPTDPPARSCGSQTLTQTSLKPCRAHRNIIYQYYTGEPGADYALQRIVWSFLFWSVLFFTCLSCSLLLLWFGTP